jgi:hypothetical protein
MIRERRLWLELGNRCTERRVIEVNRIGALAVLVVVLALAAFPDAGRDSAVAESRSDDMSDLLDKYESGDRIFQEVRIGDKTVYYHQRMIGDAIVEKDFVVYQFDGNSGKLMAKRTNWRDDLPNHLPRIGVSRDEAESLARGEIQFSKLYYISPESDVFPISPAPANPCWAVMSIESGNAQLTVIDGVTGELLGYGIPPPYTAFSMSGPIYFEPCDWSWDSWYQNAEYWFNTMGYSTETSVWPNHSKIQSHIQSTETAVLYEIAHSGSLSTRFASGCIGGEFREYTYASDIEGWIAGYPKVPFAFLASCYSMCDVSEGNLSHAFRKGSARATATIGYCDMSLEFCGLCWDYSLDWQDTLFYYMSQGWTIKQAYDYASATYPTCYHNGCIRFAGDQTLSVVPKVSREPGQCGDANASGGVDIDDIVYLIAYIFSGGPGPVPADCAGDANGSAGSVPVDIDDVVYLIAFVFQGGPPPVGYCCD